MPKDLLREIAADLTRKVEYPAYEAFLRRQGFSLQEPQDPFLESAIIYEKHSSSKRGGTLVVFPDLKASDIPINISVEGYPSKGIEDTFWFYISLGGLGDHVELVDMRAGSSIVGMDYDVRTLRYHLGDESLGEVQKATRYAVKVFDNLDMLAEMTGEAVRNLKRYGDPRGRPKR